MTVKVVTASIAMSITHAIDLMLGANVSGVPVLDDLGGVCGILTEGDLLRRNPILFRQQERHDPNFFDNYVKSHSLSVGDCMTREIISATSNATISQLALLMESHRIRRVPIIDEESLVGIVSRRDLLRSLAASQDIVAQGDDHLALAVATRLKSELGLDSGRWTVSVNRGIVAMTGPETPAAEIQAIRIMAQNIRGVCGVVFHHAR